MKYNNIILKLFIIKCLYFKIYYIINILNIIVFCLFNIKIFQKFKTILIMGNSGVIDSKLN